MKRTRKKTKKGYGENGEKYLTKREDYELWEEWKLFTLIKLYMARERKEICRELKKKEVNYWS